MKTSKSEIKLAVRDSITSVKKTSKNAGSNFNNNEYHGISNLFRDAENSPNRSNRSAGARTNNNNNASPAKRTRERPVAILSEKSQAVVNNWQWPSDHLPNVGSIQIANKNINILTQNVLDESKSNPRVPGSTLHQAPGMDSAELEREKSMTNQITGFLSDFDLITLQECTPSFKNYLENKLEDTSFKMVHEGECVTIYNEEKFHLESFKALTLGDKMINCTHTLLTEKEEKTPLRLINVHIPNSLTSPELSENENLRDAIVPEDDIATVLLGDTNLNLEKIKSAQKGILQSYNRISGNHHTTATRPGSMETSYNCSCVDHILIKGDIQAGNNAKLPNLPLLESTYKAVEQYALPLLIQKTKTMIQRTKTRPQNSEVQEYLQELKSELKFAKTSLQNLKTG